MERARHLRAKGIWFMMSDLQGFSLLSVPISGNDQRSSAANRYSFELDSRIWQHATFDLWCWWPKVPFTAVCLLSNRCLGRRNDWRQTQERSCRESASVNGLLAATNVHFSVRGMYIPGASLCKGDLHGTVGRGGWFQDRPLWAAPGDLRFLRETHWPPYPQGWQTHPHTSQRALTLPVFPLSGVLPADCPHAFVPLCIGPGFASSLTFAGYSIAVEDGGWIRTAANCLFSGLSWPLICNNHGITTCSGPVHNSGPHSFTAIAVIFSSG